MATWLLGGGPAPGGQVRRDRRPEGHRRGAEFTPENRGVA